MNVLAVNAGSSSLKLSVVEDGGEVVAARELPVRRGTVDRAALLEAVNGTALQQVDAVAHRIVHGGAYEGAVRFNELVESDLRALEDLAPLHQRLGLETVTEVMKVLPGPTHVACFDTAFHRTIPDEAATYALPLAWREAWELRRSGFHGLSHASVARRFPHTRVVSCHLGAGASVCAIDGGRSIDTSMGFTPLDGLVMATRSGSVDPGAVLWLLRHTDLDADAVEFALEHESGLRGLAGTADMRAVLAGADAGDDRCRLGLNVYVHRLVAAIAGMAAALGGLDTLVFTGGVGERAPEIRSRVASRLRFLGIAIDEERNAVSGEHEISQRRAVVKTYVLTAREDAEMGAETVALLGR